MKPTLLVLAAGMGSRFGGMKQMEPVGPSGEWILDYSVYDALAAGFGKIVFVIRKEMEKDFKEAVTSKYKDKIETVCAFQEMEDIPDQSFSTTHRQKPWGTGHAVYAARNVINEPFAVINADDFYGREAYVSLATELASQTTSTIPTFTLIGYKLRNTLSEKGSVSRGICQIGDQQQLLGVEEHSEIEYHGKDLAAKNSKNTPVALTGEETVSLNCWGFQVEFFTQLEKQLNGFLQTSGNEPKSEFYLPAAVDEQAKNKQAKVRAIQCDSQWIGMTHKDDLLEVQNAITSLVKNGTYPSPLW